MKRVEEFIAEEKRKLGRLSTGERNTLNVSSLVSITIVCVVIAVIISETTSNTASAAIVYSSCMLPITSMVKTGAIFDVIGAVLCVVGAAVMANVVGLV